MRHLTGKSDVPKLSNYLIINSINPYHTVWNKIFEVFDSPLVEFLLNKRWQDLNTGKIGREEKNADPV